MSKRKLIDKYNIPLNHIDFDYVKKCNNARELEKILQILYSGEEGYFAELMKCTEERLKLLSPNSKCFRRETEILKKDHLAKSEWETDGEPVLEWSDEVKVKDNFLSVIANEKGPELSVPDIRGKNKRIGFTKEENEKLKKDNANESDVNKMKKDSKRIKSTDYNAWDKYDAETECLKMELDEERIREENERIKIKKEKETPKIEEITTPLNLNKEIFNNLTNVEKETLSLKFKDRGNDCFRTKEYQNALIEYTKCIDIYPTSIVYNNRAITYMKLLLYNKAIEDLDKCLEIDPKNIKALLRKAQSLIGIDKRRDAYDIYTKIISIEPSNVVARNGLNDLNKQIAIQPPAKATRISIKEEDDETSVDTNPIKNNKTDELQLQEITSNSNNNNNNNKQIITKPSELVLNFNVNSKETESSEPNIDKNIKQREELIESSESKPVENIKEENSKQNMSSNEKILDESNESTQPKSDDNIKEKNSNRNTVSVDDNKRKQSSLKNIKDFISSLTNKTEDQNTDKESKKIEEENEKNKENIQQYNQESNSSNQKSVIKNTETESNTKKIQSEIEKSEKEQEEIKSNKNQQQTLLKSEEIKQKESEKVPKTPNKQIVENKKQKKKTKIVDDNDYVQEDLAKLIIPKKIVRSKLAKTLDAFKNNKLPLPLPNMNNNTKSSFNRIPKSPSTTPTTEIKLLPDKLKNEMFIKELR